MITSSPGVPAVEPGFVAYLPKQVEVGTAAAAVAPVSRPAPTTEASTTDRSRFRDMGFPSVNVIRLHARWG
jgi:hypothetical protein